MFDPRCPACDRPIGLDAVVTANASFHADCWAAVQDRTGREPAPKSVPVKVPPAPFPRRGDDGPWRQVPYFLGYDATRDGRCRSWWPRGHETIRPARPWEMEPHEMYGGPAYHMRRRDGTFLPVTVRDLVRLTYLGEALDA